MQAYVSFTILIMDAFPWASATVYRIDFVHRDDRLLGMSVLPLIRYASLRFQMRIWRGGADPSSRRNLCLQAIFHAPTLALASDLCPRRQLQPLQLHLLRVSSQLACQWKVSTLRRHGGFIAWRSPRPMANKMCRTRDRASYVQDTWRTRWTTS